MLKLEGELTETQYTQRAVWMGEYVPGFTIPGNRGRKLQEADALVSLPMFSKYAKVNMDQIPMERLLISLRDPENEMHVR